MTTEQPALIDTGRTEIWTRYRLPGGRINAAPWMNALSTGGLVGTHSCGGYLQPAAPYQVDRVDWFPATCLRCGGDVAKPGPPPKFPRGRRKTR